MGICKYCGKDAGFFGDKHPACEFEHNIEAELGLKTETTQNRIKERNTENKKIDNTPIEYCIKMIDIAKSLSYSNSAKDLMSNPSHPGYKQYAIILFKQGKYQEVIDLCRLAKSQYWKGDWDDRIEKAKQKLEKQKKESSP